MAIDREFNVTYLNAAGAAAVGKTPEACLNQKCFSLFNTDHCNTPDCQVAKAMQSNMVCTSDTVAQITFRQSADTLLRSALERRGRQHYRRS